MAEIKPIETIYKGYRFRSRLEARWAVFFDALGIKWEYEKEGYDLGKAGYYLPDFFLPFPNEQYPNAGYWFEIKGARPTDQEIARATELAAVTKHTTYIAYDLPGVHPLFSVHNKGYAYWHDQLYDTENRMPIAQFGLVLFFHRLTDGNIWTLIPKAITAARSARFEHGESPAL